MGLLDAIQDLEEAGKIDEAIDECARLMLAEVADSPAKADLLRRKAHLHDWYRSQYSECELLLLQELAIRRSLNDPTTAHTQFQLGLILNFMGRESDAMLYLQAALVAAGDGELRAKTENLLGDILVLRDAPRARQLLMSAAARLHDSANDYLRTHVALSIAWLTAVEGQVVAGEAACRHELQHAKWSGSLGLLGTANLRLAQILHIGGRSDEARPHALVAERLGVENNWQVLVDEAVNVLKQLPPLAAA